MSKPLDNSLPNITRPKITVKEDYIAIADTVLFWRIFLFSLGICFFLFSFLFKEGDDRMLGCAFGLLWAVVFLYDSISMKRVKIDFVEKKVYRTSLNPIENLIDRILQHPKEILFENIEKIYADAPASVASAVQRYYVYLRTDDPYNLKIGTFRSEGESEVFASFLNSKVHGTHLLRKDK